MLGAATLAALHKHVGDTVSVSYETARDAPVYIPPTQLVIVGTATFPAVGYASFVAEHTSMGTGALVSTGIHPPAFQRAVQSPDPNLNGPELVFVRLRPGVSATAGRADMQRIALAANRVLRRRPSAPPADDVSVLGVQRPAQIVNYRSIGSTPIILAVGLAAGAIVALGLTLAASVRRRRRDLALLKALGFTHRQLAAAVAWQATVVAVIGIIVGIPLGIVVGRQLWTLFARNINAVPDPSGAGRLRWSSSRLVLSYSPTLTRRSQVGRGAHSGRTGATGRVTRPPVAHQNNGPVCRRSAPESPERLHPKVHGPNLEERAIASARAVSRRSCTRRPLSRWLASARRCSAR